MQGHCIGKGVQDLSTGSKKRIRTAPRKGTLLPDSEISAADAHGQYRFNYRHRYIHDGRGLCWSFEQEVEDVQAFRLDSEPRDI